MLKATFKGESRSLYRLCVPPCPRYITRGDTHSLCVVCLGVKHAKSALEGAGCPHCERLPLRTLRSQRVLFEEGAFTSVPRGAGPASAEAERRLHSWGSQFDLAEGMDTGRSLSSSLSSLSGPYPHLPDPLPVLWDQKPILRFLPLRERAQRFSYLPPRGKIWRALIIYPFNPPNMRSY